MQNYLKIGKNSRISFGKGADEKMMKLSGKCAACPYKLGLVKNIINPCPACRANGYKTFEQLKDMLSKKRKNVK